MCIGVPVQVLETGNCVALCSGLNGDEQVNMMLIGDQPVGTWVLNYLGSARRTLSESEAMDINQALKDLQALVSGETEDVIERRFAR